MRSTKYLRAPIKATLLPGLAVVQRSPRGDYGIGDPPPQALEIEWDVTGGAMPQIALLWEGGIRFIAGDAAVLPQNADEVHEGNFGRWRLEGALLLEILVGETARTVINDTPMLAEPPELVRYDTVRLTRTFLFQAARRASYTRWRSADVLREFEPGADEGEPGADEGAFRQLLFDFLHGRAALNCRHTQNDPAGDFTELSMPEVAAPTSGTRARLTLSMASGALDALDPSFFVLDPFRDLVGWELPPPALVDVAMANRQDFDLRHPYHSPIPPLIVLAEAPDAAWVPAHRTHPVRSDAVSIVAGGENFRRLNLARAVVSSREASDEFRRPYLQHQIIVTEPGGARIAARAPISGHLYLALSDGPHRITAAPRIMNTGTATEGSGVLKFVTRAATAKIAAAPANAVPFTVSAGVRSYEFFLSAIAPDGFLVAERLLERKVGEPTINKARTDSQARYKLEHSAPVAHIPSAHIEHAILYGLVLDAAFRHGLAPEFLQAVMMREGVASFFYPTASAPPPPVLPYDPQRILRDKLGLDTIADNLNHDATRPPVPDIGLQYLIDNGYVDTTLASDIHLLDVSPLTHFSGEPARDHWWANIWGWQPGIEMLAGMLQARLDQMLATASRPRTDYTEDGLEFLSYVRFNGDLATGNWRHIAQAPFGSFLDVDGSPKAWDFTDGGVIKWPSSNTDPAFSANNTMKRQRLRWIALNMVAAGHYLKLLKVFR